MGQSLCKAPKTPWETVEKTIQGLIDDAEFWTNPAICQNLSVVYRDRMLTMHQRELFDIAVTIGVSQPGLLEKPAEKEQLCSRIIGYYTARLKMLRDIWEALKETRDKVDRAKNGPVCAKIDSYVDDEEKCLAMGGEWRTTSRYSSDLREFKQSEPGAAWQLWLENYNNLNGEYCTRFDKLWKLIGILKRDVTHAYTPENMQQIESSVYEEIEKLRRSCNYLYLSLVNMPIVSSSTPGMEMAVRMPSPEIAVGGGGATAAPSGSSSEPKRRQRRLKLGKRP
jgi:hypothetical protein